MRCTHTSKFRALGLLPKDNVEGERLKNLHICARWGISGCVTGEGHSETGLPRGAQMR